MTRIILNLTQTMLNGSNPITNIGLFFSKTFFFLKKEKKNITEHKSMSVYSDWSGSTVSGTV